MSFFKRKKKQTTEYITEQEKPPVQDDIKKRVPQDIKSCCEQMIEAARELKEEQDEYRVVTDYLKDIQLLEELEEDEYAEIRSAAEKLRNLDRARNEYQNSERRISDVQFIQMQQEEDRIPDAILRLQSNESYQASIKRDMNRLEGEKTEWQYNKLELLRQQKLLRGASFALLGIFAMCVAILFVLQTGFRQDTKIAWLVILFLAAVCGVGIFIKMSLNETEIRQSEVNMNYAIELLNKITFKYVNITNAVDYAREKYHVKNSYELNYLWEQYLCEVREREKFKQTNEDLQYFNTKLVRLLKRYRLYDAQVWVNQTSALVDKKEMVEVKHSLIVRRQRLRSRMEINVRNLKDLRNRIDKMLTKQNMYTPEIRDIIDSIDQLNVS
ncbi:MAG: DUF1361 domain-containing protein [Lachnospiraceae bacterium]|nr:DUF1361 domain-containing protein [Lachnospiraceae bacterium]